MGSSAVGADIITWVDGRFVPPDAGAIAPLDRGLIGDGAFEALKVIDGVPFALRRHLHRLQASARPLDIDIDMAVVHAGVAEVAGHDMLQRGSHWLRITVTGGRAPLGKAERGTRPTVIVAAAPLPRWGPTCAAVLTPWTRNERGALAGLKTLSYIENGIALRYARARGADEGLFANTVGNLCEGAGTNVFVVEGGVVRTPPLSAGALDGITRQLLLEWAPAIVVEDMPISVLEQCEELFVTSTSRGVHPVAAVDGRSLPVVSGPTTSDLAALYAERVRAEPDPPPPGEPVDRR